MEDLHKKIESRRRKRAFPTYPFICVQNRSLQFTKRIPLVENIALKKFCSITGDFVVKDQNFGEDCSKALRSLSQDLISIIDCHQSIKTFGLQGQSSKIGCMNATCFK